MNYIKGKWLAIYTDQYKGVNTFTYLVVAEMADNWGIHGPFITLEYGGKKIYSKSKSIGTFRWSWIKRIDVL